MKQKIKNLIKKALTNLNIGPVFDFTVEYPLEKSHGDFSSNIALRLSKTLQKPPKDIAETLKSQILKLSGGIIIEKIEIAEPGFINFFVKNSFWQKKISSVLKLKEQFGNSKLGKNKKTIIEFVSANPTGELHLGHARAAFYGDVLVKVLKKAGFSVFSEYYINDAKASNQIKELGKTALGDGTTYLNAHLKKKISKIKKRLDSLKKRKDRQRAVEQAGFLLASEVLKDIKELLEKKLKIKFDSWFSEETMYKKGEVAKVFDFLDRRGLIYEKEGAKWLKTSEFGDSEDRVVLRSNGEPSYLLPDIVYHQNKFKRGFKTAIDIWGADHQGHVKKMESIAKMLEWAGKLKILVSQMVSLKSKKKLLKFSKRQGNVTTISWLIGEVGGDAARYFYISKSLNTHMEFDLDLAREQSDKNPVFYIQYAYARISGILKKGEKLKKTNPDFSVLNHPSEVDLMKNILKFPELIESVALSYEAHHLTSYAYELAESFHRFYRDCRVVSEDKKASLARLSLVLASKIALKNCLDVLGISAPEKM